ncbi:MAG: cation-translocating P-type ATPase [Clostridia bacterium]|nr:cation-translocating P-type ATPase [Clostridia bacterium]
MSPGLLWYQLSTEETLRSLRTDKGGLSQFEAASRLSRYGPNQLASEKGRSLGTIFLSQFRDFMVLVLLGATCVSGLLGEYTDALTIIAIVILNALLGCIQEYRAERSLAALMQLTAPEARVVRGGQVLRIPAAQLVPGDIIQVEAGDRVPADARIIEAVALEAEESILTGESVPVIKNPAKIDKVCSSLGDIANILFMGTIVTRGRGQAVVIGTGMDTEMGRIAAMLRHADDTRTPLQERMEKLGRVLVLMSLGICGAMSIVGVLQGQQLYTMLMAGISLAVAAIPEGLPAVITVSLALGVQRMIRRKAIVRRLQAIETLGCATIICSDKTGTLTQNQMTARRIFLGGNWVEVSGEGYEPRGEIKGSFLRQDLELLLKAGALCSNARLKSELSKGKGILNLRPSSTWTISGDPTEGALVVLAAKAGIWQQDLDLAYPRLYEIPFDSDRKRMSVVCRDAKHGSKRLFVKGAPDVVLARSTSILHQGKIFPLSKSERNRVLNANEIMARHGLRVLAMAYKDLPHGFAEPSEEDENSLVFVGLVGMSDPPRPGVQRAVELASQAGIEVAVITGDYLGTAEAVARELKLPVKGVLTGQEIDEMSEEELVERVNQVNIYARVTPRHKLRIVKALKANGEVVAMTGDGVNDAPALREAQIGVAMGIHGTEVAKEAASVILQDDNFATVVAAIEEGRGIYDNIRKFIAYLLGCNMGEVLTMFCAIVAGLPLPLLPIQLLWVNLVTDGLPALALSLEKSDANLMSRPPRHPKESIFAHGMGRRILSQGVLIGAGTLGLFLWKLVTSGDLVSARTIAFAGLVCFQLFYVFQCRVERGSWLEKGMLSNPFLLLAVLVSFGMQIMVIHTPWLQQLFNTRSLSLNEWIVVMVIAGARLQLQVLDYWLLRPLRLRVLYARV